MPAPFTTRILLAGCACWPLMTGFAYAQDALTTSAFEDDAFGQNTITPPIFIQEDAMQRSIQIDGIDLQNSDTNTPLILEADAVTYDTENQVARAIGAAEAFYGERVLGADSLIYDVANGTVSATGAVALRNDDGTFLFADDASLATNLSNGTISQPRVIIEGGGKLAAVEGERVDDRYTVLSKAVYSACDVCADDRVPLWRVRADRVIHDEVSRDIIYEDATFDIEGVSVFYLPYFRHPDPTVERRSGFLTPSFSRDSTIGASIKTPYFFNLAPNRDLTITPYVTTKDGPLIEGEYRARTEIGQYLLWGSATYNNSLNDDAEFRGALRGQGLFLLDSYGFRDWYWGYGLDLASDDTFLRRYGYSDRDRTTSRLFVGSQTDRLFTETSLVHFQSFRPDEDSDTVPQPTPEFRYSNRIMQDPTWGIATVEANALRLDRETGRDFNRIGTGLAWERQFLTNPGILVTPFADAQADLYLIEDDPVLSENAEIRLTGAVGVDVRYPFIAQNNFGTHVIEPIAQVIAAPNSNDDDQLPNEDSLDIEFDETNLFSRDSRFPGLDRFESGTRANLGVRYNLETESGAEFEAVYGRVVRLRDNDEFSDASGLKDQLSDHVGALRLTLPPYLDITHRFRIDGDENEFRRHELYAQAEYGTAKGTLGYVYVKADPFAGFTDDREEVYGSGSIKLAEEWTLYGSARHDLNESRFVSSRGGLRYENECCAVDLSVKRRFNDDRDANDETSVGFEVRLKSLGG